MLKWIKSLFGFVPCDESKQVGFYRYTCCKKHGHKGCHQTSKGIPWKKEWTVKQHMNWFKQELF